MMELDNEPNSRDRETDRQRDREPDRAFLLPGQFNKSPGSKKVKFLVATVCAIVIIAVCSLALSGSKNAQKEPNPTSSLKAREISDTEEAGIFASGSSEASTTGLAVEFPRGDEASKKNEKKKRKKKKVESPVKIVKSDADTLRSSLEVEPEDVADILMKLAALARALIELNPIESVIAGIDVVEAIAHLFTQSRVSLWDKIERNVRKEVKTAITNYHEADLLGKLKFLHEELESLILRASVKARREVEEKRPDLAWRKDFVNDVYNHYTLAVRANAHLFKPSNFEGAIIYDASLFHIYFSFISHELVILKLLESQCAAFNGTETDDKYRVTYWKEKLEAAKQLILKSAIPDSKITAKNLFWSDLNYECSTGSFQRLYCKDVWKGQSATFYWDLRIPLVKATSPRKWDLYFYKKDFGSDGSVASCSGQAYFDYSDGTSLNPGTYDNCSRVSWTSGGECRKISAHPKKFSSDGSICGVSPRRIYLNAARDLWHNFTAPTLMMIGEKVAPTGFKNASFDGMPCLRWDAMKKQTKNTNWTGLEENLCSNPDDWVNGPWCYTSNNVRRECYDTTLPTETFPEGCLSPMRKYGNSYEWCIKAASRSYPLGGSWQYKTS